MTDNRGKAMKGRDKNKVRQAEKIAAGYGLSVVLINEGCGHYQIQGGPILVNWYPFSKTETAYARATKKGVKWATPSQVVKMALSAPDIQGDKVTRNSGKAKRAKARMLKNNPVCHWCGRPLDEQTATLEHIIPLKRGGLDHHNNMTLACGPCNQGRGHNMPELETGETA